MLGVRLESVDTSEGRFEKVGTCDFCMSNEYCENPIWTLVFPDGSRSTFKGYSRKDNLYTPIEVDNYLDFSEWLSGYDFDYERFSRGEFDYMEWLADFKYPNSIYYTGD